MAMKFVYIIGFGNPEMVKIGVSNDPSKRIKNIICELKLTSFQIYISTLHTDPYCIENSCHKALSGFRVGGIGPTKKYKREVFEYTFEEAKKVLTDTISLYKKNSARVRYYKGPDGERRKTVEIEV